MPISFNREEKFKSKVPDYFFMCLVTSGRALLELDGERHYLYGSALLCLDPAVSVRLLASDAFWAQSISFHPAFINVNLNWDLLQSGGYDRLCRLHRYPDFRTFLKRDLLYRGILPLSEELQLSLRAMFDFVALQLERQPDEHWSCRSRAKIFSILKAAEPFYDALSEDTGPQDNPARRALDHIHAHLTDDLSIKKLCEMFYTNHTTLTEKFRELTGRTVTDYIIDRRLELVKSSLAFTELSLEEIAQTYGFKRLSYLSEVFRQRTGTTLLKYRKNMKNSRLPKEQDQRPISV